MPVYQPFGFGTWNLFGIWDLEIVGERGG